MTVVKGAIVERCRVHPRNTGAGAAIRGGVAIGRIIRADGNRCRLVAGSRRGHQVGDRQFEETVRRIAATIRRFVSDVVGAQWKAVRVVKDGEGVGVPVIVAREVAQVTRHCKRDDVAVERICTGDFGLQVCDVGASF